MREKPTPSWPWVNLWSAWRGNHHWFLQRKEDFVSSRTNDVFPVLGINDTFVQHPASTWESESHFNSGQTKDHVLAVVNDSAERVIAFIENALTTKEEHTHSNCWKLTERIFLRRGRVHWWKSENVVVSGKRRGFAGPPMVVEKF